MIYRFSWSIFILIIILLNRDVFSSEQDVYRNALANLQAEYDSLKKTYSEEKLSLLNKQSFRGQTYEKRLNLRYQGIREAKKILLSRIEKNKETDLIKNETLYVVFLDPGHGGKDSGAIIPPLSLVEGDGYKLRESDITYSIARLVKQMLEKDKFIVILSRTRPSDGPSLYARSALCRAIKPDIAISIHLNSSQYAFPVYDRPDTAIPEINYTRVFVWQPSDLDLFYPFYKQIHEEIFSTDTRSKTLKLARCLSDSFKMNLGLDYTVSPDMAMKLDAIKKLRARLSRPLTTTSTKKYTSEDISGEKLLENRLICNLYKKDIEHIPGVEGKDLHMVREAPSIPSVLVEPLFISCPQEQVNILERNRKQEIAEAIAVAIREYFGLNE